MPRVPRYQEQAQDTPLRLPEAMGAPDPGLNALGGAIANAGKTANDLAQQELDKARKAARALRASSSKNAIDQRYAELLYDSKSGHLHTVGQYALEDAPVKQTTFRDDIKKILDQIADPDARRDVEEYAEGRKTDFFRQTENHAGNEMQRELERNIEAAQQLYFQALPSTPDDELLGEAMLRAETADDAIDALRLSEADAAARKLAFRQMIHAGTLQEMVNRAERGGTLDGTQYEAAKRYLAINRLELGPAGTQFEKKIAELESIANAQAWVDRAIEDSKQSKFDQTNPLYVARPNAESIRQRMEEEVRDPALRRRILEELPSRMQMESRGFESTRLDAQKKIENAYVANGWSMSAAEKTDAWRWSLVNDPEFIIRFKNQHKIRVDAWKRDSTLDLENNPILAKIDLEMRRNPEEFTQKKLEDLFVRFPELGKVRNIPYPLLVKWLNRADNAIGQSDLGGALIDVARNPDRYATMDDAALSVAFPTLSDDQILSLSRSVASSQKNPDRRASQAQFVNLAQDFAKTLPKKKQGRAFVQNAMEEWSKRYGAEGRPLPTEKQNMELLHEMTRMGTLEGRWDSAWIDSRKFYGEVPSEKRKDWTPDDAPADLEDPQNAAPDEDQGETADASPEAADAESEADADASTLRLDSAYDELTAEDIKMLRAVAAKKLGKALLEVTEEEIMDEADKYR